MILPSTRNFHEILTQGLGAHKFDLPIFNLKPFLSSHPVKEKKNEDPPRQLLLLNANFRIFCSL